MAVSDPSIVASRVDVLLLVVRAGKNKLATIRSGCELLSALGVSIVGAVINDVTNSESQQYGGAYHDAKSVTGQAGSAGPHVSAPITVSAVTTPVMQPVGSWFGRRQ